MSDVASTRQKQEIQACTSPTLAVSLLSSISTDTVMQLLSYLDHRTLAKIQLTSKFLQHYADLDTVWRPTVQNFLQGKLCLIAGLSQQIRDTENNPMSRGVVRSAVQAAIKDSKRCVISKKEICSLRYNMRPHNFPSIPAMHRDLPDSGPRYIQFREDSVGDPAYANWRCDDDSGSCWTEGEVPEPPPICTRRLSWKFVPAMQSLLPLDGGRRFMCPELEPMKDYQRCFNDPMELLLDRMITTEFTCFQWGGDRHPHTLKVWRHPENWSVCFTDMMFQYSSSTLPPLGSDPAFDKDEPFLYPENFQAGSIQRLESESSTEDSGFDVPSDTKLD